ncbi:hypothetical protein DFQ14_10687 [Halopolyspora algeriensis]|uniref:Uncharacterized protein n=1 Tax=Halopolyspora algeriensis TaxID=1500506 RepID=A0A368VPF6_9ACTN|nr:hypothetical protein [Halopolyspora algeriensis]RCW43609.1 hypothetical protein DFQ14_10687 [Halopolyspora algeriensis]TQM47606.1 hypothetical protein FHU43_3602 [Halopolyspora algeriensis]
MTGSTRRSAVMPAVLILFGIGLLAVLAIFGLFAAGYRNLPVWLNLAAMLAPLALGVGLVSAVVQARRDVGRPGKP